MKVFFDIVTVDVDEPRQHQSTVSVDHGVRVVDNISNFGDPIALDPNAAVYHGLRCDETTANDCDG
jgi:hypothetical protein